LENLSNFYKYIKMKNKKVNLLVVILFFMGLSGLNAQQVADIDGNIYKIVKIGEQVWMAENLKTTGYNDGTAIPLVTDSTSWGYLTTPAYCWYDNDKGTYENTYGILYNWYAVNTGKLCPSGWHVPADEEWTTLTTYLGGGSVAGGKLKSIRTVPEPHPRWAGTNDSATNITGFTALPGGFRGHEGGFGFIGSYGAWWTATEKDAGFAISRSMSHKRINNVGRASYQKTVGFSVRCIKD